MSIFGRAARALAGMGVGKVVRSEGDTADADGAQAGGGVLKFQTDFGRHLGLRDGVPLLQHFGFTSRPPAGSDVLAIHADGDPTNLIIVASGNKAKRLRQLAEGDAAVHDARGAYLWLTPAGPVLDAAGLALAMRNMTTGTITASEHVELDTPLVKATGELQVETAATGVFTSQDGHVVTVVAGIVTKIV